MERRCPHCNEPVPSNSLNCPSCFRDIPREETANRQEPWSRSGRKDGRLAILLSVIPGVFGAIGLGLLYLGDKRGWGFLMLGLPLFILVVALLANIGGSFGWALLSVGLLILFVPMFIVLFALQLIMTLAASIHVSIFPSS